MSHWKFSCFRNRWMFSFYGGWHMPTSSLILALQFRQVLLCLFDQVWAVWELARERFVDLNRVFGVAVLLVQLAQAQVYFGEIRGTRAARILLNVLLGLLDGQLLADDLLGALHRLLKVRRLRPGIGAGPNFLDVEVAAVVGVFIRRG